MAGQGRRAQGTLQLEQAGLASVPHAAEVGRKGFITQVLEQTNSVLAQVSPGALMGIFAHWACPKAPGPGVGLAW